MLNALIEASLKNRFLVLALAALVAGLGIYSALHLPIDAVPDLTNVQVQVITEAPALSPMEVETFLSFPVEGAMSGLPDVEQIRSISKFGISVVTIVFHEGTDLYRARQLVSERLGRAAEAIPKGYGTPTLGPISTALGEVYQFQVKSTDGKLTPMQLRTKLDWFISYQLRGVPGVTEINSHGGELRTFQVEVDPDKLSTYHLTMTEVFDALRSNNANVGGGYLVHEGEARYIRGVSQAKSVDDIAAIVIDERNGVPVTIASVAAVHPAPMIRAGLVTKDGKGEVVTGLVMMLIGQNSRAVVERVKAEVAKLQKDLEKEGIEIVPLYDRSHLIDQTLHTVLKNLGEGGALVIVILLLLLGNIRGGLIVALAIPLAMMTASSIMLATGVTASLMSLGAIDFGLIVDSSVIMVENCVRRLGHEGGSRPKLDIIRDAAVEVRRPTMFGELIIAIVYLPILALQGTEGKLFRPMALTVIFALAGSMVLSLTLMPVLASMALDARAKEKDVWLIRWLKRVYRPMLDAVVMRPAVAVGIAVALLAVSVPVALNLGGEFMPRLNEGDLLIEAVRLPSASLEGAVEASTQIEDILKGFPEVRMVYCKTGRPEIANDVMGVHQTDVWTLLKPQSEWREGMTRDRLIEEMDRALTENVPGVKFGFSQPIEMRVNELVAGVKSDVAALIYGPDLDELRRLAADVERVLAKIPGAQDLKSPSAGRLPMLRVSVRRDQLARYGVKASDVLDAIAALGGTTVGTVFEGQVRSPIQVRLPLSWRNDPKRIEQIRIVDPKGRPIALRDLADVTSEEGPNEIERENVQRRAVVGANVRGRDIAGFVADAQAAIEREVAIPGGYLIRWGGQFEHLRTASDRLLIVVPLALALIGLLLYMTLGSMKLAALIFLAVPMAATGGIFALAARGLPFSISAGVGFIALFGVAVLNGLVWVSAVEHLRLEGVEPHTAAEEAAMARLRPVLMTALVAGFGFVPMALATTPGAEIQRPLATVVIGGLVTSTLLTLLVLPSIYPWFAGPSRARAGGDGPGTVHIDGNGDGEGPSAPDRPALAHRADG